MLAHLKAKQREEATKDEDDAHVAVPPGTAASSAATDATTCNAEACENIETRETCDVLCSLSHSTAHSDGSAEPQTLPSSLEGDSVFSYSSEKRKSKSCPKQHQLPMFLSKTYHMISSADAEIATWSSSGDNFVVKSVEKFASEVLPLYFKHSNFSSFARQLNFYGFRKLRTDPILTSDVDPRTASYVRFYHEKFQKDRPDMLHQIKRATKSDQQSKDDVDSLKSEVMKLKDCITTMSVEMDRKLAEMSYEYNRRITTLNVEYDKLAALVTQLLAAHPSAKESLSAAAVAAAASLREPGGAPRVPDLMQSLSHVAALSLQNHLRPPHPTSTTPSAVSALLGSRKRSALDDDALEKPVAGGDSSRQKKN